MSEVKWRIYYADGSTFDSSQGEWKDAPSRGVQVIIVKNAGLGWITVTGGDYYIPTRDGFRGVDIFGLFDWLIEGGEAKFGRTITSAEYQDIYQRALADSAFGRKHGYLPNERKP